MAQTSWRVALLTSCFAGPCLLAPLAAAQTATDANQPAPQEEIVVTALKQGASALDTPATVAVVSAQQLVTANITSAQQLSGIVPGYFSMQGTTGTSASFRGLGSNASDPTIESSVGTFIDGVYLGHVRDFTTPLYDVQQIEFIAGTQSTLLGKNTSLGAVSITTRRPDETFGYDASLTGTSEIDGRRFQGAVDTPLGGGFALRTALYASTEDGFIHNAFVNRSERQIDELSARMTLEGDLGSHGDLTLIYQHDRRRTKGQYFELVADPNGTIAGIASAFGQTAFDAIANDVTYSGSERLDPNDPAMALPFDNQDSDRATAIAAFDLGSGLTLTAQTSFVEWSSSRVTDLDFTSSRLLDLMDRENNRVYSQEVRIASPQDHKLSYLAGVFYYNNRYQLNRAVGSDIGQTADTHLTVGTEAWSEFASLRYSLTDRLQLLAGLRGTQEDKTATYDDTGPVFADIPLTTLPTAASNNTDGNVGLEFHPNNSTMLYATWARGSKSGGYQSAPDSLDAAHYDGEVADTAEVGVKFNFGSQGSLSFAVFDTQVDGFQTGRLAIIPPSTIPQTIITNSDVRSTGASVDGSWTVSDHLQLGAGVTYADSRFTSDIVNETSPGIFETEVYKGMVLPRAPRWMGQLTANYRHEIGDSLQFRAQGALRYASSADLQFRSEHPLAPKSDAHTTIDAQISVGSAAPGWEIALIGANLTDERYLTFDSESPIDGDAFYGTRARPRTIALQLRLSR